MKIDLQTIEELAVLARLDLTQEEKNRYAEQLSLIFGYIDTLSEVDTENVPETTQVTGLIDITREDIPVVTDDETQKKLLDCFPQKQGKLLKVKAIFKKE